MFFVLVDTLVVYACKPDIYMSKLESTFYINASKFQEYNNIAQTGV